MSPEPRSQATLTLRAQEQTDLSEQIDACLRKTDGAFSASTQRAIRADVELYAAWCARRGIPPLPVRAATLAAFVDAMGRVRAPATVRRYVASIAALLKAAGFGPTHRSAAVRHAMQRMHRRKGRRQAQALGLTWPLRERLIEASGERLIDARNRALLAVAYDALLRRSELSALQVNDVVEEIHGCGTLLVRRAKTDPEGRGARSTWPATLWRWCGRGRRAAA